GTLALAVASGIPWPAAAELANYAAGVAVAKQGTATCSLDELELEIADTLLGFGTKLHTAAQAGRLAAQWRRTGQRVGFTNGCFDLLHPGHISLLRQSRAACDRLIVGLNSDASVQRLKGPTRPLQSEVARAAVLAALGSVDLVVIFDEDTPLNLIDAVRPSVLLKGADYTLDQVVGADVVMAYGGEVKLVDLVQGQSTTSIISRMNA
ncbi:D-glycero-beta-D-manno-heptose 1-phosphate adenylyltransferase, partial [Methylobacterium trifolii]